MRVLMIQRAEQFSPNSVERDLAILQAVASRLEQAGHRVSVVSEQQLPLSPVVMPQCVFTMGRLPSTQEWLTSLSGVEIVNSPTGIAQCARSRLEQVMSRLGTPRAPEEGPDGYWLKRGDAAAQSHADVVFAPTREQLQTAIQTFRRRGIRDFVVSAHVKGDLVKFYGVCGTGFFRCYYPTDDGQTKFDDEAHNGVAHHFPFSQADLQHRAEELAAAIGVPVYGGDCIVRADGSWCMIDFNDWPSFSRCREAAADAIASLVNKE